MKDLSLTILTPTNAHFITEMYKDDEEGAAFLGGYDRERIVSLVDADQRCVWLVFRDNMPIGFIDLQKEGCLGYFAYFVAKPYRRQGYGAQLLDLLEKKAEDRGITSLEGAFEPENIATRKTLEKMDFVIANDVDHEGMIRVSKVL